MRLKLASLLVVLSLGIGGGSFSATHAASGCQTYQNSSPNFFFGYGWACAYTGSTCRECYSTWPGGYTVCVTEEGKRPFCYDYQDW